MATTKDICADISQPLLDSSVEDIHIADIVSHFSEWESFAPYLGISETEESDIKEQYPGRPKLQRRQALRLWKQRSGSDATYRNLITVFCNQGRRDVAETLKDLAQQGNHISTTHVLDVFYQYLIDCYTDFPHPSSSQWPFSSFKGYIDLELCNTPIHEGTTDSQKLLKPVELHSLLCTGNPEAKRKVVLVEGVAGSGKTTLVWYACNQWAKGKLFQEVKLLIHVSFSESEFQSASKLADLIPHPSEQVREAVAKAISDIHGKDVCFLLDACDEAPRPLWQSFLGNFIAGKGRSVLPNVSIVLASRSGVTDNYKCFLSGKVVVKGFTPESLHEFIEQKFQENPKDKELLTEALEMKPELHSLCCYPLNAVILVHLFDYFRDNIPTTQTGLFHPLICNFLVRHIHTRESKDISDVPEVRNLPDDLPPSLAQSFTKVSQIAFKALLENKKIDKKFLASVKLDPSRDDMLGLLQIRQTIMTMYGPKQQYTFLHLSIQEYLAAIFITGLDNQEQAIEEIYRQNPLSPVLAFYAGMTNLLNSGAQTILFKVLRKDLNSQSVLRELINNCNPATDTRRQLLALTNCLYECQNQDLQVKVMDMLSKDPRAAATTRYSLAAFELGSRFFSNAIDIPDTNFTLPFLHMVLHPTDMLSIGNFARMICEKLSENSVLYLDLSYCNIGDVEFKALANEMHKEVQLSKVMLRINNVLQTSKTALSIKKLVHGQSNIAGLLMENIKILQHDVQFTLKCIIEGLSCDSACVTLSLSGWSLNSLHIHHLTLLLICTNITCLFLSNNDLHNGIPLLSKALLYTKELFILDLSKCNIDDEALVLLGQTIHGTRCPVFHLSIEFNPYTDEGLAEFFTYIILSNITLLGAKLNTSLQKCRLQRTNDFRQQYNLPLLEVRPYHQSDNSTMEVFEQVQQTHFMKHNPQLSTRSSHHQ